MNKGKTQFLFAVLILVAAFFSSGCVHVDVTVALHDKDFGATITERLRVTRTLKKMCRGPEDMKAVMSHLTKEAAMKRLKNMGKGVTLTSHKKVELPDGSSESISVYTIPNINHLQISNPYIYRHPASLYKFNVAVRTKKKAKNGRMNPAYGKVSIYLRRIKENKLSKGIVSRVPSPAKQQLFRDLQPVFADMLSDLQIALKITVPTRFIGHHYEGQIRGIRGAPKKMTLFSVSGRDTDMSGGNFFENEEIMIKLLQMDLNNSLIQHHAASFTRNYKTPVLRSGRHQHGFWFYPTRFILDKYFGGKKPTR